MPTAFGDIVTAASNIATTADFMLIVAATATLGLGTRLLRGLVRAFR